MPNYIFTAMDANGKEQKGKKEAASEEEVSIFLKSQGLFPTSIKLADKAAVKAASAAKNAKKGADGKKASAKKGASGGLNMNISLGPSVIKEKDLTVLRIIRPIQRI